MPGPRQCAVTQTSDFRDKDGLNPFPVFLVFLIGDHFFISSNIFISFNSFLNNFSVKRFELGLGQEDGTHSLLILHDLIFLVADATLAIPAIRQ